MERGVWRATVHVVTESDTTEQMSTHPYTLSLLFDTSKVPCESKLLLLFLNFYLFIFSSARSPGLLSGFL